MNKRLALAKAVYPDREWFDDAGMCWMSRAERTGYALSLFDPESNAEQFCDVLAWLFANDPSARVESDCVFHDDGDRVYERPLIRADHDGTASGIRRAVVQAAERCV